MKAKWFDQKVTAAIRKEVGANLAPALTHAIDEMHDRIGTQGPPRSSPGEAPHMDSGQLFDSLYIEVDASGLQARIGSTIPWAVYTEQGTDSMAPRPWFLPSILKTANDMAKELGP